MLMDKTDVDFLTGKVLLASGDISKSVKFFNSCVSSDDSRKDCAYFRAILKTWPERLNECNNFLLKKSISCFLDLKTSIVDEFKKSTYFDSQFKNLMKPLLDQVDIYLCLKYCKVKDLKNSDAFCRNLLHDTHNIDEKVLSAFSTLLIESDKFEEANALISNVSGRYGNSKLIKEIKLKLNEAEKKSKQIDPYKVLGISKDASKDVINKAYRKLAQKWHPDKYPEKRELAEHKMRQINDANAILSDDKKRALYDSSVYPDDSYGQAEHASQGNGAQFIDLNAFFRAQRQASQQRGQQFFYRDL